MSAPEKGKKASVTLNTTVEFADRFEAFVTAISGEEWNKSSRLKALAEADMECGDLLSLKDQKREKDTLRKELAVALFVILATKGRIGSSEAAKAMVDDYLAGNFDAEVRP